MKKRGQAGPIRVTEEQLREYAAKGLIPADPPPAASRPTDDPGARDPDPGLLPAEFESRSPGTVTFVVPVRTASETNQREWRARSKRTGAARQAVSRLLGPNLRHLVQFAEAFASGHVVRVHLVRMGGKRLDRLANLGASLKAVEDAVALMIGADDGADHWVPSCDQEPGGPFGVRVTLSLG